MRFNQKTRDEALQKILVLKHLYEQHERINTDVRQQFCESTSNRGGTCPLMNKDGIDKIMSHLDEMNRDIHILLRNISKISHYLLVEPNKRTLDRFINIHFELRAGFSEKWKDFITERKFLCYNMILMDTPDK